MKILKIIAFANLFTIMTGCDPSYSVFLANQSNKNIYVIHHVSDYPDTSIVDYYPSIESYVGSQDTSIVFYSVGSGFFIERDTVSLFVIEVETVNHYTMDTVIKYNMVLQRYDLSRLDMADLGEGWGASMLYFPPNEKMRHIHMWPPYGTYDENGRK